MGERSENVHGWSSPPILGEEGEPQEGSPGPDVATGQLLPVLSDADWREMLGRLAHEIRNPLATIYAAAQCVQVSCTAGAEVQQATTAITAAVSRINRILKDLRGLVNLHQGSPQAVTVAAAVAACRRRVAELVEGRQVELRLLGCGQAQVFIDPGNLHLALGEVLTNAVNHSPDGGKVDVTVERRAGAVAIHVDDEGPGIPAEIFDQIGRPFFSRSARGTGLGLTTAQLACRLAGGELSWRNLAGQGARFTLSLPAADPCPSAS